MNFSSSQLPRNSTKFSKFFQLLTSSQHNIFLYSPIGNGENEAIFRTLSNPSFSNIYYVSSYSTKYLLTIFKQNIPNKSISIYESATKSDISIFNLVDFSQYLFSLQFSVPDLIIFDEFSSLSQWSNFNEIIYFIIFHRIRCLAFSASSDPRLIKMINSYIISLPFPNHSIKFYQTKMLTNDDNDSSLFDHEQFSSAQLEFMIHLISEFLPQKIIYVYDFSKKMVLKTAKEIREHYFPQINSLIPDNLISTFTNRDLKLSIPTSVLTLTQPLQPREAEILLQLIQDNFIHVICSCVNTFIPQVSMPIIIKNNRKLGQVSPRVFSPFVEKAQPLIYLESDQSRHIFRDYVYGRSIAYPPGTFSYLLNKDPEIFPEQIETNEPIKLKNDQNIVYNTQLEDIHDNVSSQINLDDGDNLEMKNKRKELCESFLLTIIRINNCQMPLEKLRIDFENAFFNPKVLFEEGLSSAIQYKLIRIFKGPASKFPDINPHPIEAHFLSLSSDEDFNDYSSSQDENLILQDNSSIHKQNENVLFKEEIPKKEMFESKSEQIIDAVEITELGIIAKENQISGEVLDFLLKATPPKDLHQALTVFFSIPSFSIKSKKEDTGKLDCLNSDPLIRYPYHISDDKNCNSNTSGFNVVEVEIPQTTNYFKQSLKRNIITGQDYTDTEKTSILFQYQLMYETIPFSIFNNELNELMYKRTKICQAFFSIMRYRRDFFGSIFAFTIGRIISSKMWDINYPRNLTQIPGIGPVYANFLFNAGLSISSIFNSPSDQSLISSILTVKKASRVIEYVRSTPRYSIMLKLISVKENIGKFLVILENIGGSAVSKIDRSCWLLVGKRTDNVLYYCRNFQSDELIPKKPISIEVEIEIEKPEDVESYVLDCGFLGLDRGCNITSSLNI